jgi:hypothetical protein
MQWVRRILLENDKPNDLVSSTPCLRPFLSTASGLERPNRQSCCFRECHATLTPSHTILISELLLETKRRTSPRPLILPLSSHELLPKHAMCYLSSFAHRRLLAHVQPPHTNTVRRRRKAYLSGSPRTSSIRMPINLPQLTLLRLPSVGG